MNKEYKILILEDIPADAELMEHELRKAELIFSSKRVDNRDSFIKELDDFSPDLVLSDYKLPQFDALSALAIIREKSPMTPVIVVSGTVGEEVAVETLKQGAEDYVLKDRLARLGAAATNALSHAQEVAKRIKAEEELRTRMKDWNEKVEMEVLRRTEELFKSQLELDKQTKTLQAVFANLEEAVVIMDKEGKFLLFNPVAEKIGGAMTQAAMSEWSKLYGIFYPDGITPFPPENLPNVLALHGQKVANMELVIKNEHVPEGIYVIASASPITNIVGTLEGAILVFRDITDRKKMEEKIERHEQELQEYVDHMSNFNAKVALDGRLILVNKIAEQVSGMPHEALMKTNFLEGQWWSFDPEVQERVRAAFKRAVGGETISYEEKLLAFGKEVIWINFTLVPVADTKGKTSFIIAEGLNITDRKTMEQKLASYTKDLETEVLHRTMELKSQLEHTKEAQAIIEEENEHSKILLESIGDGIVVTDQNGKVLNMNQSAEEMFGIKKQSAAGDVFWDIVQFEDENGKIVPKENRPTFRSIHSLEKVTGTYTFLQKGDGKLTAIATSTPVIYRGKVAGVIVVFHDVTREKEIEKSKTEFVSLASHQLRTPLSSIRWRTEEMLSEEIGPLNDTQKQYAQKVYNANQRMIKLTDMFLDVSRIETGSLHLVPESVNLPTLHKEALSDLSALIAEKKLSLESDIEETLPPILTDRNCLLTVLQNLLSNAVKYTPNGGKIKITAASLGETITVSISDTGYGIPKNDQSRIFTKLFRAGNISERETDGNGLGLYLVKSTLELLGGKIWFESQEDKGTTFFFEIPIHKTLPD